jgi:DNA primase large subunit
MNLVLAAVVIAEICLGICAWRSAECLRWLAAHLLTKADVIDLSKAATERRMQFWSLELGVDRHGFVAKSRPETELETGLARQRTAS